ncbi:BTB/POZ domain and ankyrin repeat-containing protein NPR5-like isoform X1 [Musa acuminata AAA Group]|uniref:BTB/POZ domain and ankyrin repeat-containing protein NPR5-like isoform X1 n=1 Tax=Musa acuminata AAA Group TaxID=214697 RepID=UPI0031DAFA08
MEETLKSLSLDYLNLLINGQAFSDVTFSVEGRLVHAHRCILAARSLFFRSFFCGTDSPPPGLLSSPRGGGGGASPGASGGAVVPVNSVSYEVFLLMLQFLYSGQVSVVPQKHEPRPNCGDRGCWHTHCAAAVDLALDTLAAARSFGVKQLEQITESLSFGGWVQKQLASMVEKASIEDVMKVLMASRQQDMQQLWATCSHLVAKSGLPAEVLAKHLPIDVVARIEELRLKSSFARRPSFVARHPHQIDVAGPAADLEDHHHKIRRMRRALDSSDVELVKLMVMGEGLNLDDALALHYAVENCTREVVKALLELGAADVNCPAGPTGKTPLHIAAEMVSPDMVAVLLDHHADPNVRTVDGVTPLEILRTLTSDFLFKGAVPGLSHIEPNKLRLCLELVQSAALVMSREEANSGGGNGGAGNSPRAAIYPRMNPEIAACSLSLDSRMVYLNLGMAAQFGSKMNDGGGDESLSSRPQGGGGGGGGVGPSSIYPSHGFP